MAQGGPKLRMKMEILEVLDRLENIAASATKLPLTKRVVLNPQEIRELVGQVRNTLPADMNEAVQIIRYRDSIIAQAQADADRLRAGAQREAQEALSESQITKEARKKAEELKSAAQRQGRAILAEAQRQAASHASGADAYAVDVLRRLERELDTLLETARHGLQYLETRLQPGDASEAEAGGAPPSQGAPPGRP